MAIENYCWDHLWGHPPRDTRNLCGVEVASPPGRLQRRETAGPIGWPLHLRCAPHQATRPFYIAGSFTFVVTLLLAPVTVARRVWCVVVRVGGGAAGSARRRPWSLGGPVGAFSGGWGGYLVLVEFEEVVGGGDQSLF